jgi:hypothetical protein
MSLSNQCLRVGETKELGLTRFDKKTPCWFGNGRAIDTVRIAQPVKWPAHNGG